MYHYQFYFPFLLTLESLKDQDGQESEQDRSLFWMWNSPPVYLVLFTFYAIMMLIEIVIVSDMWSNHVMTCWCLFFMGPSPPKWTHLTTLLLVYFLDTPKSPKTLLIIISKWEHVMYRHQGYNESIKAENTLIIKNYFFISNRNLKKFNKKFKIYKKIGSIYVCRAKCNTFLDMNMLYDE